MAIIWSMCIKPLQVVHKSINETIFFNVTQIFNKNSILFCKFHLYWQKWCKHAPTEAQWPTIRIHMTMSPYRYHATHDETAESVEQPLGERDLRAGGVCARGSRRRGLRSSGRFTHGSISTIVSTTCSIGMSLVSTRWAPSASTSGLSERDESLRSRSMIDSPS